MYTGQIFFRESSHKAPDGRRIMMFTGLVAMDEYDLILSETQCTIVGQYDGEAIGFTVFTPGEDLSEVKEVKGAKIGDLLLRPMWRV